MTKYILRMSNQIVWTCEKKIEQSYFSLLVFHFLFHLYDYERRHWFVLGNGDLKEFNEHLKFHTESKVAYLFDHIFPYVLMKRRMFIWLFEIWTGNTNLRKELNGVFGWHTFNVLENS